MEVAEHPIADPLVNTDEYVGQNVTVISDVEAIVGTHVFTLAAPQGPFLVVSATGIGGSPVIERGAPVRVREKIRDAFSVGDIEDEFGLDLDQEALAHFDEQTYLVADSVMEPRQDEDG